MVFSPNGSWRRQAIITIGVGIGAFTVGTLLYRIAGQATDGAWLWPGLQPLVWALLVFGVSAMSRNGTTAGRVLAAVLLAPVATAVDLLVAGGAQALVATVVMTPVFVWIAAGMLGAATLGAIAGSVAASDPSAGPRTNSLPLFGASITALAIGGSLAFALAWQWSDVYFTLGGEAVEPSPAAADRYLLTAGIALAFLVLALVLAAVRRRAGMIWLTVAALGLAVLAALVFQVPQGRFFVSENPAPYNSDAPVCFGTSGDCPGG